MAFLVKNGGVNSIVMILYNVTFNENDTVSVYYPRIPLSASDGENKAIKRICLSDSIEHCIQAIAAENRPLCIGSCIIVREIDTDDLNNAKLLRPRELFEKGLVPDALENSEYWYLEPIQFKVYKCIVADFRAEYEIAWSCVSVARCREIITRRLPNFDTSTYKNPKAMYDAAMLECEHMSNYNAEDDIWDDLVSDPIAQKRGIYDLKLANREEITMLREKSILAGKRVKMKKDSVTANALHKDGDNSEYIIIEDWAENVLNKSNQFIQDRLYGHLEESGLATCVGLEEIEAVTEDVTRENGDYTFARSIHNATEEELFNAICALAMERGFITADDVRSKNKENIKYLQDKIKLMHHTKLLSSF